jgi:hypothetical protein
MRILRVLSSEVCSCGCLLGIYETYNTEVVRIVDAVGEKCRAHQPGQRLDPGDRSIWPGSSGPERNASR